MWDGRETALDPNSTNCVPAGGCFATLDVNLRSPKAHNATIGHAQAAQGLSRKNKRASLNLKNLVQRKYFNPNAGFLDVAGAIGGAEMLSKENFSFGMNDLLKPHLLTGAAFSQNVRAIFLIGFLSGTTNPSMHAARQTIARGELIFNSRVFNRTPQVGVPNRRRFR